MPWRIAFSTTGSDLEAVFATAGTVESASVINDRESGRSRGFGFVEMSSDAEAQAAIQQLNGQDLKGRALRVNEAMDKGNNRGNGGGFGNRSRH